MKNFRITPNDPLNWIIEADDVTDKGNPITRKLGYFPNLLSASTHLLDVVIKDECDTPIETYEQMVALIGHALNTVEAVVLTATGKPQDVSFL